MMFRLHLEKTHKYSKRLRHDAENHYSQPKGFVGRSICYYVKNGFDCYGSIVGGSATLHLAGRDNVIPTSVCLENIVNNIFYHIEKIDNKYPCRNFAVEMLQMFRERVAKDWLEKYGDKVLAFESLVELPRTGEIYRRDKWIECGLTKGFTCKRTSGIGTDNWTGKRVWDTVNLRPKRVFVRMAE